MPRIRCPDGVKRDYADYEDNVKPIWKEEMRKYYYKCKSCGHDLTQEEASHCMGFCPKCFRDSLKK